MRTISAAATAVLLAVVGFGLPACDGSPAGPTPACTFALSPSALSFGPAGGSTTVTVTTATGCAWTAAASTPWLTIPSGAAGTGTGSVTVAAAATSSTAPRTATLTIAGHNVQVQQQGLPACTLDLNQDSASFDDDGGAGSFAVSAPEGCTWQAASSAEWLVVTSGSQGSGNGTVAFTVAINRNVGGRTGTIAVGGESFTVAQSGDVGVCAFAVAPVEFTPCMPAATLTAALTTQDGCPWTATADASWISITGAESGSGSSAITFNITENYDAPRQGIVMVRWPTATAGQNLHVRQAGCFYAVSRDAISVGAAGGTDKFDVIQFSEPIVCGGPTQSACRWTAQADVPWITITTSMPQAGDNPVSFTVAPNTGTSPRTGTITVRDKVVRITQAGS